MAGDDQVLKLFVVGVGSGTPGSWDPMSNHAIVLAHNANEAEQMAECVAGGAYEVEVLKPAVLSLIIGA